MSTNQNNKVPITNDLRTKVLHKFTTLHAKLQTATPPEQLERSCFDKANNDQDTYLKLCNNLVSNRTRQLESSKNAVVVNNQVRAVLNSNFRPNVVGQISNGVVSDPINALQNLTVTAGQPNQINMQQGNPQLNYRVNQQGIIQMTPNAQMHQRIMVAGNIRPLDQFSLQQQQQQPQQQMCQSPNPQLMSSQIQVHGINSMNVVNTNSSIRLINKNSTIKPDQITQNQAMQLSTYQMDSNGSQINNQHLNNVMHSNMVRPVNRIVSSSPIMSIPYQSGQEHYTMLNQTPQPVPVVQTNNNTQSEDMAPQQNLSSTNTPTPQNAPSTVTKSPMSEEEALKVKEELAKLSTKYFRSLKLALENPINTPMETIKIWAVLKGILDTSKTCDKPITLKHVAKIQLFSEKADEHVVLHNLDPSRSQGNALSFNLESGDNSHKSTIPTSEELFGKRIIPDRNQVAFNCEPSSNSLDISSGLSHTNSLDAAFDDILHQIQIQKPDDIKKVRNNLILYIRMEKPEYLHFLPKSLQSEPEPMETRNDDDFDEHEFDFIDDIPIDGVTLEPYKQSTHRAFDTDGLLRIGRDFSFSLSDPIDLRNEFQLLSKEFDILQIESQLRTSGWVSGESEWDNSKFYTFKFKTSNIPIEVPPIIIRIPDDYEQSLSVDWNLNIHEYPTNTLSDVGCLSGDIEIALQDEFSNISCNIWNAFSLLDVLSIYKRSIKTGISNYECRKSICY